MNSPSVNDESDIDRDERPSSRPTRSKIQATFRIARPPPKSSLRLAPKLLLQIQQLAQSHRPVPVLEVWQPPFRKSKLTRDFHQQPKLKLRSGDIYTTRHEPYITSSSERRTQSTKSGVQDNGDGHAQDKAIVAAMCQSTGNESTPSRIHFRDARCSWQASIGSTGPAQDTPCYRFTINDEKRDTSDPGRMIMQWEKRSRDNVTPGSLTSEQFVLVLIDTKTRRKSRIATMTPGGVEIVVRKTAIMKHLQVCVDLTEPVTSQSGGRHPHENLEMWLYTHVLTLGVWVAQQEGWLNWKNMNE